MNSTPRLHRFHLSGHSHRAQLLLSLLGVPHTLVEVDLKQRQHKSDAFLALNTFGQVPVLEDGEVIVADSNAILTYLGNAYDPGERYFPRSAREQAEIQRWLSVAAGPLAFGPARLRLERVFGAVIDRSWAEQLTTGLFSVLESVLSTQAFLLPRGVTIADIALYTYCAHAPEGGFSLSPYPHISAWLRRIEALPGFVAMTKSAVVAPSGGS